MTSMNCVLPSSFSMTSKGIVERFSFGNAKNRVGSNEAR